MKKTSKGMVQALFTMSIFIGYIVRILIMDERFIVKESAFFVFWSVVFLIWTTVAFCFFIAFLYSFSYIFKVLSGNTYIENRTFFQYVNKETFLPPERTGPGSRYKYF